jgi:hypothetical protein
VKILSIFRASRLRASLPGFFLAGYMFFLLSPFLLFMFAPFCKCDQLSQVHNWFTFIASV